MKIILTITISFVFIGCSVYKYPNYKVTPQGYVIWRYTKTQDEVKHIFSNGDTLFDNGKALVFLRKSDTIILADYSKITDSIKK